MNLPEIWQWDVSNDILKHQCQNLASEQKWLKIL